MSIYSIVDPATAGKRNQIYKFLCQIRDKTILYRFYGLADNSVVVEKTRQSIQGVARLTLRMCSPVNCRFPTDRTNELSVCNRLLTCMAKVRTNSSAPNTPLGEKKIEDMHQDNNNAKTPDVRRGFLCLY